MNQKITNFIKELYGNPNFVPLHAPVFCGNEKKYLEECIDTTFVSSVGKFVDTFELKIAEYTGSKYAVACVSGTNALHISLILAGIQREDEVITQPVTFVATPNAISYTGAKPIFLDVDKETMGLSASRVEEFLLKFGEIRKDGFTYNKSTGKRIFACIPMHTFGHPVKLKELVSICAKYNIQLIEDAAESLGSKYYGTHTGTTGKLGILSFNGNKVITTGGGGMILTNDEKLAKLAKHITTQAKVPHPYEFVHDHIGYNYRMPNINAAIGCAQLEKLPEFLNKKRQLSQEYKNFFSTIGIRMFTEPEGCLSNYWLNVIFFNNRRERDQFLEFSNKNGVMTRPTWCLMNKLDMFKDCQTDDLTNSQWFEDRAVNIPSSVI